MTPKSEIAQIAKKTIGLVDVARKAGVNISTVSRTINQTGRISPEVQKRVRGVMKELGYRPNRVARRLRVRDGRCHLLGLLLPNIQSPFFADLARGVEDIAYKHNFAVILCNYDEDPKREAFYLDVLSSELVDGIIVPPIHENDVAVARVIREGIPVVCVDRSLTDVPTDRVEIDNAGGAFDAVSHLIKKGHRRIGIIGGPAKSSTGRERSAGYREAHKAYGLEIDLELARTGDYKKESGRLLASELLALPKRPTALFVCNGLMTIGALEVISERKLRIPQDIAIIGFDELPLCSAFTPPLTTVRQPAYEVGRDAAELLFRRLDDPKRPFTSLELAPELVVRSST